MNALPPPLPDGNQPSPPPPLQHPGSPPSIHHTSSRHSRGGAGRWLLADDNIHHTLNNLRQGRAGGLEHTARRDTNDLIMHRQIDQRHERRRTNRKDDHGSRTRNGDNSDSQWEAPVTRAEFEALEANFDHIRNRGRCLPHHMEGHDHEVQHPGDIRSETRGTMPNLPPISVIMKGSAWIPYREEDTAPQPVENAALLSTKSTTLSGIRGIILNLPIITFIDGVTIGMRGIVLNLPKGHVKIGATGGVLTKMIC